MPRPLLVVAGGVLVAACLPVAAALTAGSSGTAVQASFATPSGTSVGSATADPLALLEAEQARERAQAGRGASRPAPSPAGAPSALVPSATVEEPAAAEVPPAEASVAPEVVQPTPTPLPEPEPVPAVVGQLWVTTDVNVRSGPSPDLERIGSLAALAQVDVTGATENGWTQVVTDGRAGWVKSSYLSEAQPEPEPVLSGAPCPISSDIESALTSNALAVYRAVCAAHGDSVSSFGGYRRGDSGDHGSGRAVDIMVSGEPGWEIARFVQAHAADLGVTYVIYQQRIWQAGNSAGAWEWMSDRGSATANHYDHVHVSVR